MEENERVIGNGVPGARTLRVGVEPGPPRTLRGGVEETTRVLTEAAISGKIDYLRGLKEKIRVQQPSDDELELDRETCPL